MIQRRPRPDGTGIQVTNAPLVDVANVNVDNSGVGTLAAGTYQYKVMLVDQRGVESTPSAEILATVGTGGRVDLSNLPGDPTGADYPNVNVYRTGPNGQDFFFLGFSSSGWFIRRRWKHTP